MLFARDVVIALVVFGQHLLVVVEVGDLADIRVLDADGGGDAVIVREVAFAGWNPAGGAVFDADDMEVKVTAKSLVSAINAQFFAV